MERVKDFTYDACANHQNLTKKWQAPQIQPLSSFCTQGGFTGDTENDGTPPDARLFS
ncbi:MAG: hypothetical protein P1U40_00810 [Coxiellaceae bacterium]|nr:hypothetical protein [Coxiellaceae bacterium]